MRKISAHYVFPGNARPLRNGVVCINDEGVIVEITDTGGKLLPSERLEHFNGILVPGFINAHCHLELSYLKGVIPQGRYLPDFLTEMISHRDTLPETIEQRAQMADREMYRNGIRAVGDISNGPHSFNVKKHSSIAYYTFVELTGLDPEKADGFFSKASATEQRALNEGLTVGITPHAAYSVSGSLASRIQQHVLERGSALSIHHMESASEDQFLNQGSGPMKDAFTRNGILPGSWAPCLANATEHLTRLFPLQNENMLLVHNTYANKENIRLAINTWPKTYWVLCPSSNLFIENRLPDIPLFRQYGLDLCLGTDSYASNNTLSILQEMLTVQESFDEVPLGELIRWATWNGAKALNMEQNTGSIEPGKSPGLNIITDIDFRSMKLTTQSRVKRIA